MKDLEHNFNKVLLILLGLFGRKGEQTIPLNLVNVIFVSLDGPLLLGQTLQAC